MFNVNNFSVETTFLIAVFSAAWFLIGLILGKRTGGGASGGGAIELYVGNLSYDVREKDLKQEFGQYGGVKSARIIKNKYNNKSKGFGFVEMADRGSSLEAIRALNGKEMQGRRIVVNEAKSEARG